MRNEQFVENSGQSGGNYIWINNVEFTTTPEENMPVIGACQLSTIFPNLDSSKLTTTELTVANPQTVPIQNNGYKLPLIDTENNFIILKDDNIIDEKTVQPADKNKVKVKMKNDKEDNFEDMLYFVCNLCPFLCTKDTKITEHLAMAHKNKTKRKLTQLKCPACKNVFYHKISLRSHLVHDHGVSNSDLSRIIQAVAFYSNEHNKPTTRTKKSKITVNEVEANEQNTFPESVLLQEKDDSVDGGQNDPEDDDGEPPVASALVSNEIATQTTDKSTNGVLLVEQKPESRTISLLQLDMAANCTEDVLNSMIHQNGVTKYLHKCRVFQCKVRLQDANKLTYHMKCHVDNGFKCLECNETFTFWKPLTSHLWRIHKVDMELYSCDKCDYKTYSLGKLNSIHKLIHSDVKAFACTLCAKAFKNSKQLRNHMTTHKKSEKIVRTCEICSKQFSDKRQLNIHMDVVHKKIKPFLCSYCGYKGSSRSSLKMHIRQHTGEKPFACDVCTYTTSDHNSLRRHKFRHTGQKPYVCVYCPYACIQSSTYKVHLKTKHPGLEKDLMFTCEECSFKTVNKEKFTAHILTAHKPKTS